MLTDKNKRIIKYHISVYIVGGVTICVLLTYRVVLIVLCICLALLLFFYLYKRLSNIRKSKRRTRVLTKDIQRLIHDILELEYVHSCNHAKFHAKLLDLLTVESLLEHGVVSPEKMSCTIIFNREIDDIDPKDAELLALLKAGFSTRDIKVLYALKDLNSVYTKTYRLNERLSDRQQKLRKIQNGRTGESGCCELP